MNRHFELFCLLCAVALLFPPQALPQRNAADTTTVSGTVYIDKDNRPIFNALVRLCDNAGDVLVEVTTSDSGDFAFHGIAPGKYILQISADGFETISIELDLNYGSDRGVPVYLKPVALTVNEAAAGGTVSVHELSMPKIARDSFAAGKK